MNVKNYLLITNVLTSHKFSNAKKRFPNLIEGDYLVKNFTFKSGENLEELKLHYTNHRVSYKDKNGQVNNAVLIMHGTTGTGAAF
jgi:homoserine O-acetyltransferase